MSTKGLVASVSISTRKGTPKEPVESIHIENDGVRGDAHRGPGLRQVSLLSEECVREFNAESKRSYGPGDFAENVTVRGVALGLAAPLDRIRIGTVELEVTQLGKRCHGDGCAIFQAVGRCLMPSHGVFARVISEGTVRPGDAVELEARPYRFEVVTLSDRAFRGEYSDRSGPAIEELLTSHAAEAGRPITVRRALIPDDPHLLGERLRAGLEDGLDAIITTGGTGIGPRDFAPEVVQGACERMLPGIMETIRVKYGLDNPRARLSRGVAGVAGTTQLYALPGSVKAVREYIPEILLTFDHVRLTLHGLDDH